MRSQARNFLPLHLPFRHWLRRWRLLLKRFGKHDLSVIRIIILWIVSRFLLLWFFRSLALSLLSIILRIVVLVFLCHRLFSILFGILLRFLLLDLVLSLSFWRNNHSVRIYFWFIHRFSVLLQSLPILNNIVILDTIGQLTLAFKLILLLSLLISLLKDLSYIVLFINLLFWAQLFLLLGLLCLRSSFLLLDYIIEGELLLRLVNTILLRIGCFLLKLLQKHFILYLILPFLFLFLPFPLFFQFFKMKLLLLLLLLRFLGLLYFFGLNHLLLYRNNLSCCLLFLLLKPILMRRLRDLLRGFLFDGFHWSLNLDFLISGLIDFLNEVTDFVYQDLSLLSFDLLLNLFSHNILLEW